MSDQTSCQIDFFPDGEVSTSSMTNCLPSQFIVMSFCAPFMSHVYGSRFWHSIPCKVLVVVFHHMIPRRKPSASGKRTCSSSSKVNPPGPGRQVSSPVFARPFGADVLGSNFTLSDQSPVSALVRLSISAEGCGADVSD